MTETEGKNIAALFVAGALRKGLEHGLSEKDAEAFAVNLYKEAARKRLRVVDDDEDDEEDTFWNRHKHWLLPTLVGTGAFLLGSSAERYGGRADRNYFSNAARFLGNAARTILGISDNPLMNAVTKAPNYGKKTTLLEPEQRQYETRPVDRLKQEATTDDSSKMIA